MITILRRRVACNIWVAILKGQGHSMTSQQKCVRSFILLFEVGFYNYLITILRWCVTTLPIVLALYVVYCIIN